MIRLSRHAKEQCETRGFDPNEVESICAGREAQIKKHSNRTNEVRVVVKRYAAQQVCSDGSNGDIAVACVDTRNGVVKTVMLQRRTQAQRKRNDTPYLGGL